MNNTETDLEILLAATRYEKIRKLDPQKYTLLWGDSLFSDIPFDKLVDALPEPFRVKMKAEPTADHKQALRDLETALYLLQEIEWSHRDNRSLDYNKCEGDPCQFCTVARTVLPVPTNGYQQINNE
jgi:hypothetical protein